MNNKILIAASIGLSLFAAAQSQTDTQKPKTSTAQTQTAREAASGQPSGKKSAQDDWSQKTAVSTTNKANTKPVSVNSDTKAKTRVATGDVNGDGAADATAGKNSAHATESFSSTNSAASSKDQHPRDVATGQASGKRQHQPMTVHKADDKTPNQ